MTKEVAVITGANSGIGLAIADRLLAEKPCLTVCLACRNFTRATAAKQTLLLSYPAAQIDIVVMDTSSIKSVMNAVCELKAKYSRIDYCYFNAGILPTSAVNWDHFWKGLFSMNVVHMLTTGEGLMKQIDSNTDDGLHNIFATNVFGHFILLEELMDILGGKHNTQVMWTSSSNANRDVFSLTDIQHKKGQEPYASSKYLTDLVSVAINEKYEKKGVYSHTVCPGLVMTNLTNGIVPQWFWAIVMPLLYILRFIVPSLTIEPYNAAESLVWLSRQDPRKLNPCNKYHSQVSVLGVRGVMAKHMDIDMDTSLRAFENLKHLQRKYSESYDCHHI